ncbi:MAG: hypothetical protein AAF449_17795, partial [Myxococcota bacterium]
AAKVATAGAAKMTASRAAKVAMRIGGRCSWVVGFTCHPGQIGGQRCTGFSGCGGGATLWMGSVHQHFLDQLLNV